MAGRKLVDLDFIKEVVAKIKQLLSRKVDIDPTEGLSNVTFVGNGFESALVSIDVVDTEDNHNVYDYQFPVEGYGRDPFTLAVLESESQDMTTNTLTTKALVYNGTWYGFPGSIPPDEYNYDSSYGGDLLTTRFRGLEVNRQNPNNTTVELMPGAFNYFVGSKMNIAAHTSTSLSSSRIVEEYWLLLEIPSSASVVNITFDPSFAWAGPVPDFTVSSGYQFLIHVVGNMLHVMEYNGREQQQLVFPVTGVGSLSKAIDQARADRGKTPFQWIMTFEDTSTGTAVQVQKPIWHVGSMRFIDANGYVISE